MWRCLAARLPTYFSYFLRFLVIQSLRFICLCYQPDSKSPNSILLGDGWGGGIILCCCYSLAVNGTKPKIKLVNFPKILLGTFWTAHAFH